MADERISTPPPPDSGSKSAEFSFPVWCYAPFLEGGNLAWVRRVVAWAIAFITLKGEGFGAGLLYMVITVGFLSLVPLTAYMAGGSEAPFLFNALFRLGSAIACALCLLFFFRAQMKQHFSSVKERKNIFNFLLVFAIIGGFLEHSLFAWSIQLMDIAVATILYELWPVAMILLMAWLYRHDEKFQKVTIKSISLVLLGLLGAALAYASQSVDFVAFYSNLSWQTAGGVCLALLAIIAAALSACGFRWGTNVSYGTVGNNSLELFFSVVAFMLVGLFGALISGIIAVFRLQSGGENIPLDAPIISFAGEQTSLAIVASLGIAVPLMVTVIGGTAAHGFPSITWRAANFAGKNLGINALSYLTPVLGLCWLFLFAATTIPRMDYLAIGTTLIVVANLLLNVDLEVEYRVRYGFKALLIALAIFGILVYLRDGIFEAVSVDHWDWGSSGYFESIGLAATVFTLILAFRVARMVTRANDENNRIFSAFRKLDLLAQLGVIDREIRDCIRKIADADNDTELKRAYNVARGHIVHTRHRFKQESAPGDPDIQIMLNQAESDLDTLIHSRQVEVVPGERFGLWIFAAIIIVLALATQPGLKEDQGWALLMVDIFALLISSVVVFLMVNVADLQREREERRFEIGEAEYDNYRVWFPDPGSNVGRLLHYADQWIYVGVGVLIVVVYVVLFWLKWL